MKKIIALILSVIMLLSSACIVVAAGDEGVNQSGDLAFAKAMGFIDSSIEGNETITRIELAEIYYRIIVGSESQIGSAESEHFSDVFAEDAFLADFVMSRGIMNGVEDGFFAPEREVTYIQLLKTMVVFLGYDMYAQSMGGYPSGYYSQAASLKIAKDNPDDYNVKVTYNKVASVLKLAANVDLSMPEYNPDTSYEVKRGLGYLEEYCDIYVTKGVVQSNYLTSISEKRSNNYNQIVFGNEYFELGESAQLLRDMVGKSVELYYRMDDSDYTAVYFEEGKNEVVEINGTDLISLSGNKLNYDKNNGNNAYVRLSDEIYVVYNGTLCENYDFSVFNQYKATGKDGGVELIDNNADGEYDVAIIDAYDSYVVSYVTDKQIFNRYRQSEILDVSGYESGDIEIINILGQPLRLSDIEADDIISVSSDIKGQVKRIIVTVDSYVGTLEQLSYDGETAFIKIDGLEFKVSASLDYQTELSELKKGDQLKIYFNKDAFIAAVETDGYEVYNTGYLTSVYYDEDSDTYNMKIFTAGGKFERFTVKEKVYLENVVKRVDAEALLNSSSQSYKELVRFNNSGQVERTPLLYKADKETKEIDWLCMFDSSQVRPLNVISDNAVKDNCLFIFEELPSGTYYRESSKTLGGKLLLSADSVVFIVPTEANRNDERAYYAEQRIDFRDETIKVNAASGEKFELYGKEQLSPKVDIVVHTKDRYENDEMSGLLYLMLVDKVSVAYDEEEGEAVNIIKGYSNGEVVEYKADNEAVKIWSDEGSDVKRALKKGDIIRVMADAGSKVRKIQPVYDSQAQKLDSNVPSASATFYSTFRVIYGTVGYKDDTFITVKIPLSNGDYTTESYPYGSFKILEYNKTDDICSISDGKHIFDEYNYPGNESKVIVRTYNGDARTIVVINE